MGRFQTQRGLVAALKKQPFSATTSRAKALVLWHDDASWQLRALKDYDSYRRALLNRDIALMSSSLWRFDLASARSFGLQGFLYAGSLVLADLFGGYLGRLLLRRGRRRRSGRIRQGA